MFTRHPAYRAARPRSGARRGRVSVSVTGVRPAGESSAAMLSGCRPSGGRATGYGSERGGRSWVVLIPDSRFEGGRPLRFLHPTMRIRGWARRLPSRDRSRGRAHMCMGVYLATDRPQPLVEWREVEPSFNVTELSEQEAPVRGRFS